MYIQIVNFNLSNTTPAEFEKLCRELAPQFAALPGLISKVFLLGPLPPDCATGFGCLSGSPPVGI